MYNSWPDAKAAALYTLRFDNETIYFDTLDSHYDRMFAKQRTNAD